MTERAAPAASKLLLGLGVFGFWAVLWLMTYRLGVSLLDGIVLGVLLGLLPGFALAQVPMIGDQEVQREPAYWSSILSLWLIGTACWMVGTRDGGAATVALGSVAPVPMLLWSVGLTGAALLMIYAFRAVAIGLGHPDAAILRDLMPRTDREKRIFGLLSLAAGVCEEIAYRAYVITALAPFAGLLPAAAISSIAFGVVHAYQGVLGIVRTTLLGALLAWGFVATGSLWPVMVAHTAIDLLAGIVLGDRLLVPERPTGVEPAPHAPDRSEPWT